MLSSGENGQKTDFGVVVGLVPPEPISNYKNGDGGKGYWIYLGGSGAQLEMGIVLHLRWVQMVCPELAVIFLFMNSSN